MSTGITASVSGTMRSGLGFDVPSLNIFPEKPALLFTKGIAEHHPHRVSVTHVFPEVSSSVDGPGMPVSVRTNSNNGPDTRRRPPALDPGFSLRSVRGMQGLIMAENGGGLVELDPQGGASGFKQGTRVLPGLITPRGGSFDAIAPSATACGEKTQHTRAEAIVYRRQLSRRGTLLSQGVTPARNAAELKSLLGNSRSKLKYGAKVLPSPQSYVDQAHKSDVPAVSLEQGKSRARVEVDILLDSGICVEGCYLTGKLQVKVKKPGNKGTPIFLGEGKLRVVGFEGIPDNNERHTFYQQAASLSVISASSHTLYASPIDEEGFSRAREGMHVIPFAMKLPVSDGIYVGAKGPFDNNSGIVVKYIVIASFKLKDNASPDRSIAHFYRSCEIFPYLSASTVMAPAASPLLSTVARNIFLGGTGKLKLTASLHRNSWVAGQRCCVGIAVHNESKKTVKGVILSLIRTITVFHPQPDLDVASPSSADPDACQTTTTRKLVAETSLEAGQRGLRGHVTAKGWWTGVDPGARMNFAHYIFLPPNALSIVRSRLLEVQYAIRVSLVAGSLSSEVSVMLPVRIVNHLSVDPPPSYPTPFEQPGIPIPVPPLAIPILDSVTSTSSWNANMGGGLIQDENLESVSDGTGVRELGASDNSHPVVSSRTGSLLSHMPMPQLTEEEAGLETSSFHFQGLHDADNERREFPESQNYGIEESYCEGDDIINRSPDWTGDILGNLHVVNSDEEVDLVVGSADLENDGGNRTRSTDFHTRDAKETQHVRQGPKNSAHTSYDFHSVPFSSVQPSEGAVSKKSPPQQAMRQNSGSVAPSRPRIASKMPDPECSYGLPPQVPKSPSSLPESSVACPEQSKTRKDFVTHSRPTSPRQKSNFSKRVDRLVAARRATAQIPILSIGPESSDDIIHGSSVGETGNQANVSSSEVAPESSRTALHLLQHTSSPPRVPVHRHTSASPTVNSVKSRIAELEEMCKATSSFGASFIPS